MGWREYIVLLLFSIGKTYPNFSTKSPSSNMCIGNYLPEVLRLHGHKLIKTNSSRQFPLQESQFTAYSFILLLVWFWSYKISYPRQSTNSTNLPTNFWASVWNFWTSYRCLELSVFWMENNICLLLSCWMFFFCSLLYRWTLFLCIFTHLVSINWFYILHYRK